LVARNIATGMLFLVAFLLLDQISRVEGWNRLVWMFLAFLLIDLDDDRRAGTWLSFLPGGLLLLGVGYLLYRHAPQLWWAVARWERESLPHLWNWNEFFRSIPYNDGDWLRRVPPFAWLQAPVFTPWVRWVYAFGFALAVWGPVIRSFFARDAAKMLRYMLATHILQFALIMPFYALIRLEEVWWVLGRPDPFERALPPAELAVIVQNCFPSMHTSVAFAALLLALRERGQVFRWLTVAYTAAIIYSTVHLEIHWLLDLPPGLLLGWASVRLTDLLLKKVHPLRRERVQEAGATAAAGYAQVTPGP
jgi:membrane-associated phospholipid phosphatase